jgi:hypothetical protein
MMVHDTSTIVMVAFGVKMSSPSHISCKLVEYFIGVFKIHRHQAEWLRET